MTATEFIQQYNPRDIKYQNKFFDQYGSPDEQRAEQNQSSSSSSRFQISPTNIPPPSEPVYPELQDQYGLVPSRFNTKAATSSLDAAIEAIHASSGQAGQNAARSYSQRLTQQGQNPVAAGVVQAQVEASGNRQAGELAVQRDNLKLQANKDAAMVAAGLAEQISSLRNDYVKTLADYNSRQAGLNFRTKATNATNAMSGEELALKRRLTDAQLAQLTATGGGQVKGPAGPADQLGTTWQDIDPGYIPSFGPIVPGRMNGAPTPNRVQIGWV